MTIPNFPNISVRESVVGPIPFQSYWRNRIGIAAVFNRGPVGPITIESREDFAYLYGEDTSPGSMAVRQAFLQGATNFTLSRVMPSASPSYGNISLQGLSPLTQESFVSIGNDRTVGLSFKASYISPAVRSESTFIGDRIRISGDSNLNFPEFTGTGTYNFEFVEKVDISAVAPTGPITFDSVGVCAPSGGTCPNPYVQVISASGASGVLLRDFAKPGLILSVDGTDVSGNAIPNDLTVLTYAYESEEDVFSIAVIGSVTGTAASMVLNLEASAQVGPDYFVLRYSFVSPDGSSLGSDVWSEKSFLPDTRKTSLGFITINENDRSLKTLENIAEDITGLSLHDTGIRIGFGNLDSTLNLEFVIGSEFQVSISQDEVQIGENNPSAPGFPNTSRAFYESKSGLEVLSELRTAISQSYIFSNLFGDFELNQALLPYSLTIKSSILGDSANRIRFTLSRTVGGGNPSDLLYGASGSFYDQPQNLVGATDSMTVAERVLYDINGNGIVLVQALSPGEAGNRIRMNVRPLQSGRFSLELTDEGASISNTPRAGEVLSLSNYSVDQQSGLYMGSIDSNLVRVFYLPLRENSAIPLTNQLLDVIPQRLAPPVQTVTDTDNPMSPSYRGVSFLTNVYLQGGSEPANYNPSNPDEVDVIEAIRRLESVDLAFLLIPGIITSDSRYSLAISELIIQAERSGTTNGLRIAILQAPPRLTSGRAPSVTAGITSNRVVVVAGHVSIPGSRSLGANSVPVDGIYAGQLAVIPPHVSPAAVSGGHILSGIQTSDTKNEPAYLEAVTDARMETVFFDPGLNLYKFLNGITASSDFNERYVSIRRTADQIIMDLYRNLQWIRSSPHTPALRSRVASAVDAYLTNMVREQRILGFRSTVCDESNNTIADISRGRLNILTTYTPVFPADFITIDLVRDLTSELTLTTL